MISVGKAAVEVLTTPEAADKAAKSIIAATRWRDGTLTPDCKTAPPDRPARPEHPILLPPGKMPRRRSGGNDQNRIAFLHSIAHIELNAIDLAWDIIARFGDGMPRQFLDAWVSVGADEARHFTLLAGRLEDLGGAYGDLPAHDGLWQVAFETRNDLLGRIAIVPLVLEARGLDVTPSMIKRYQGYGDTETAAILKVIYEEEIDHVKAGAKWFQTLCEESGLDPEATFQKIVKTYFTGELKPPFNEEARTRAGLPKVFYQPLSKN